MTALSDLVERTKRHLYTETRDQRNRLAATITAAATTLTCDFDLTGIVAGVVLAIDAEEMTVWNVDGGTIEVERGTAGSTATAHTAGTAVLVNPKFSTFRIIGAINDDLADLSSPANGLYQVKVASFDFDAGTGAYNLSSAAGLIDVLDVAYDAADSSAQWPSIHRSMWKLQRNMPAASFSGRLALTLIAGGSPGQAVRVAYKAPFDLLSDLDDDVEDSGLPTTAFDLPPLGAAINLTVGGEVARNFLAQGDTRRADEVPPGARLGQMRGLAAQRAQRIAAESARLYAQYPTVKL